MIIPRHDIHVSLIEKFEFYKDDVHGQYNIRGQKLSLYIFPLFQLIFQILINLIYFMFSGVIASKD